MLCRYSLSVVQLSSLFFHLLVWTPAAVTTTGALLILYLCLGGFFVGMLLIAKKIRNDGDTVRVVDVGRLWICLQWAGTWAKRQVQRVDRLQACS